MSVTALRSAALSLLFLLSGLIHGDTGDRLGAQARAGREPLDLASFFGPRGLTRDGNGDGIADTVAARVIVPAIPALEDSTAAANVAGRLGFETSSLSLTRSATLRT
jgi:hypothetical protein